MSSNDRETRVPVETVILPGANDPLAPVEAAITTTADDLLALVQAPPPLEPEKLVAGLHFLQQLIPEFTHLSVQEKRSHARAANLDPEFIEAGLQAAEVWHQTEIMTERSGAELRQEDEAIRRWDNAIVRMRAIADGMEAANLKRKHRLGRAILLIYRMLGTWFRYPRPEDAYMRPYYENMRRAYLRTQKFSKRKKKEKPVS